MAHSDLDVEDLVTRLNAYYSVRTEGVAEILTNEFRDRGRLLRIANSAALSTGAPIASVRAAILKIGAGRVLSYALSGPLSKQMQRPIAGYGLGQGVLWRHLVASALAVEMLDGTTKVRVPSEAFAAALQIGRASCRERV